MITFCANNQATGQEKKIIYLTDSSSLSEVLHDEVSRDISTIKDIGFVGKFSEQLHDECDDLAISKPHFELNTLLLKHKDALVDYLEEENNFEPNCDILIVFDHAKSREALALQRNLNERGIPFRTFL